MPYPSLAIHIGQILSVRLFFRCGLIDVLVKLNLIQHVKDFAVFDQELASLV